MKRQVFFTFISALIVFMGSAQAQNYTFRVNYDSYRSADFDRRTLRRDRIELERFRSEVDYFRTLADRRKVFEARRVKAGILKLMRQEIRDTRYKIRRAEEELYHDRTYGLRQKGKRTQEYGKREYTRRKRGRGYNDSLLDLQRWRKLEKRQLALLFKLENTHLDRSKRYWKQVRKHIRVMHDFERTMEKDLYMSRAEIREKDYGR